MDPEKAVRRFREKAEQEIHGPTLVKPVDERGTFSFPRGRNQAKWLCWSMLRTKNADCWWEGRVLYRKRPAGRAGWEEALRLNRRRWRYKPLNTRIPRGI